MLKRLAAAGLLAGLSLPAAAGEAGDILRMHLYDGNLAGGLTALEPYVERNDPEGRFGYGMLQFVQGIEQLAQALYRHGLAAPDTGALGPALTVPVERNPNPEPLDYAGVRGILEPLVATFETASEHLYAGGQSGDYVIKLEPEKFRIDVNADGSADESETAAAVMARVFGSTPTGATAPSLTIGFDRADGIWLAGYTQVLLAHIDFLLAHDFGDFVNVAFHRLFPQAKLPMQEYAVGGTLMFEPGTDTAIADAIAAIHTINWRVVEPDRLKRVLQRANTVLRLSRENWRAILAETDDDNELLPGPQQPLSDPDDAITEAVVAAWMETLATAKQVLDGKLLLPHWRFRQGFDIKAYFETATRTDLVLLLTGYDALPFIKDGPVASAESFAAGNRVFGDNFFNYIFWFN